MDGHEGQKIFPPIFHFLLTTACFFPNPTHIFSRPLLNPKPIAAVEKG